MTNNPFFAWLSENILRLQKKSPAFFKVWQWISAFAFALTGLPEFIVWISSKFSLVGIELPEVWKVFMDKTLGWVSLAVFIMSSMTTKGQIEGVTEEGKVVKSNPDKMPFTERADMRQMQKEGAEPDKQG